MPFRLQIPLPDHLAHPIHLPRAAIPDRRSAMKMMTKRWIAPAAILLLTFCALPVFAADVTGKWTCKDKDADANVVTLTFVFKQEGTELTGTFTIMDDSDKILDSTSISSGKVDGDKISFATLLSDDTNFTYEGTINADEIRLTSTTGTEIQGMTLKRYRP